MAKTATATVSKGAARKQRVASQAMYAQRPKPAAPAHKAPVVDMRLRRLTTEVLDQLKVPGAIPSQVIYAALEKAASK